MSTMTKFMSKFGQRKDAKDNLSYTTHDDKQSEPPTTTGMASFLSKFSTKGDEYEFVFKDPDQKVTMRFDKAEHVYTRIELVDDVAQWVKIPSVTTILGVKDKSAALMAWAANETAAYARITYSKLTDEEIGKLQANPMLLQDWLFSTLDEATKNYKTLADDATDVGKQAHDWLEAYINAAIANDAEQTLRLVNVELPKLDERAISCCEAALGWMRAHNVRWKMTERKIYSRKYDVAGTLDGCCIVDSCDDPKCCPQPFKDVLSIIDWKSSNALRETYRWQTAVYEDAIEDELGWDIRHRWVIRLGKFDGAFDTWHITEEDFEMDMRGFLACRELYLASEHCVTTLRERRRAAREKAKAEREAVEAAAKQRRAEIREAKKQARIDAKQMYKDLRNQKVPVAEANVKCDAWLTNILAEISEDEDDNEVEAIEEVAA